MDAMTKKRAATALRSAAKTLEARGPTTPRAVYRVGTKPGQSETMRSMRDFFEVYAQAGNDLMEGRDPGERIERLQNLATLIGNDLDDLVAAVRELA